MRTRFLFIACSFMMLFFSLSSFTSETSFTHLELNIVDSIEINAVYDSSDERGYTFIIQSTGEPIIINKIDDAVLSQFDLNAKTFVGSTFKVTYVTESICVGSEAKYTKITKLEKL